MAGVRRRRRGIVGAAAPFFARFATLCILASFQSISIGNADQQFHPLREKLGWSTSRELVDIEITRSTGVLPSDRTVIKDQSLRLRLERAYISIFLTNAEPGSETLSMAVNRPTGLPNALIETVSIRDRFHQEILGIPILTQEERIAQVVNIRIRSTASSANLLDLLAKSQSCITSPSKDGLAVIEPGKAPQCRRSAWPTGEKWLASAVEGARAIIECHEARIGCSLSMPFRQFEVKATFHRSNFKDWREIMSFVDSFLTSKIVD